MDTTNGFGRIRLTKNEEKKLHKLRKMFPDPTKVYAPYESVLGEYRYLETMETLFPMFSVAGSEGSREKHETRNYQIKSIKGADYKELPIAPGLCFGSLVCIGANKVNVDLRVIMPPDARKSGYFMSTVVTNHYKRECIDDVVNLLGERENQKIIGVQEIRTYADPLYGIPQVPQLSMVLKLYGHAAAMLENIEESAGVNIRDANVLRQDAHRHENMVIRELSAARYKKILEQLVPPLIS